MIKKRVFGILIFIWIILWLFFLFKENKKGQYVTLHYLYSRSYFEKLRYLLGGNLYDLLVMAKQSMPEGATYDLIGIEDENINRVRARYFLWPLIMNPANAEYKIIYGNLSLEAGNYKIYKQSNNAGYILKKEAGIR